MKYYIQLIKLRISLLVLLTGYLGYYLGSRSIGNPTNYENLAYLLIGMFLSATWDLTFFNLPKSLPAIAHLIFDDPNLLNKYSVTNFPVNEEAPQIIISNCFINSKIKKNGHTTSSITV